MANTAKQVEDALFTNTFKIWCTDLHRYEATQFGYILEALDDPSRQLTSSQIKSLDGLVRRCKLRNSEILARQTKI